jgi:hypothetical protein
MIRFLKPWIINVKMTMKDPPNHLGAAPVFPVKLSKKERYGRMQL